MRLFSLIICFLHSWTLILNWLLPFLYAASTTPAAIQKGKNEDQITMISLAIGFGAGVPLLAIIAIVIWRRRLKKRHMSDESSLTSLSGGTDTRERSSHNAYECTLTRGTYSNGGFIAREDMEPDCGCIAEISRERLTYVEKLGEGAFGKVKFFSKTVHSLKCFLLDVFSNSLAALKILFSEGLAPRPPYDFQIKLSIAFRKIFKQIYLLFKQKNEFSLKFRNAGSPFLCQYETLFTNSYTCKL